MELKYFPDTDTLLINFTHKDIVDTRDINENILVELDQDGHLVSMTVNMQNSTWILRISSYQNVASISRS